MPFSTGTPCPNRQPYFPTSDVPTTRPSVLGQKNGQKVMAITADNRIPAGAEQATTAQSARSVPIKNRVFNKPELKLYKLELFCDLCQKEVVGKLNEGEKKIFLDLSDYPYKRLGHIDLDLTLFIDILASNKSVDEAIETIIKILDHPQLNKNNLALQLKQEYSISLQKMEEFIELMDLHLISSGLLTMDKKIKIQDSLSKYCDKVAVQRENNKGISMHSLESLAIQQTPDQAMQTILNILSKEIGRDDIVQDILKTAKNLQIQDPLLPNKLTASYQSQQEQQVSPKAKANSPSEVFLWQKNAIVQETASNILSTSSDQQAVEKATEILTNSTLERSSQTTQIIKNYSSFENKMQEFKEWLLALFTSSMSLLNSDEKYHIGNLLRDKCKEKISKEIYSHEIALLLELFAEVVGPDLAMQEILNTLSSRDIERNDLVEEILEQVKELQIQDPRLKNKPTANTHSQQAQRVSSEAKANSSSGATFERNKGGASMISSTSPQAIEARIQPHQTNLQPKLETKALKEAEQVNRLMNEYVIPFLEDGEKYNLILILSEEYHISISADLFENELLSSNEIYSKQADELFRILNKAMEQIGSNAVMGKIIKLLDSEEFKRYDIGETLRCTYKAI